MTWGAGGGGEKGGGGSCFYLSVGRLPVTKGCEFVINTSIPKETFLAACVSDSK